MKISQLIKRLEGFHALYGDLEVHVENDEYETESPSFVLEQAGDDPESQMVGVLLCSEMSYHAIGN